MTSSSRGNFAEIYNSFKYFCKKSSVLDVWLGFKYAFALYPQKSAKIQQTNFPNFCINLIVSFFLNICFKGCFLQKPISSLKQLHGRISWKVWSFLKSVIAGPLHLELAVAFPDKFLLKCVIYIPLRIYWRHSTILNTSNKRVWSTIFWYVKIYIFWKFIQRTIHWDKTNVKRVSSGQNKYYEKYTVFSFASSNS